MYSSSRRLGLTSSCAASRNPFAIWTLCERSPLFLLCSQKIGFKALSLRVTAYIGVPIMLCCLPSIHRGEDRILWRFDHGHPTAQALYRLFDPPGPKVGWSSLLSGSLKIPRHSFILWLAILGKLATTDKPWLAHLGPCILCNEGATESHGHLFFQCRFSRQCLAEKRRMVRYSWPNREWTTGYCMGFPEMEG
ncbi:UNVERIFIED_CONTAM: hypothetical protein Sindi_2582900 [Sesamum indicum]